MIRTLDRDLRRDRLMDLLDYNPDEGIFTWKKSDNRWNKVGKRAATRPERGGHCRIRIDGVRYLAQRLAWLIVYEKWPEGHIRPVNKNASDLRISNWIDCRDIPSVKRKKIAANHKKWREKNPEKWRANNRRHSYGLEIDDHLALLEQNEICAICKQAETYKRKGEDVHQLCVDHCHSTGEVRQLLCRRCNQTIGITKESPALLREMADYIERHAVRIAALQEKRLAERRRSTVILDPKDLISLCWTKNEFWNDHAPRIMHAHHGEGKTKCGIIAHEIGEKISTKEDVRCRRCLSVLARESKPARSRHRKYHATPTEDLLCPTPARTEALFPPNTNVQPHNIPLDILFPVR